LYGGIRSQSSTDRQKALTLQVEKPAGLDDKRLILGSDVLGEVISSTRSVTLSTAMSRFIVGIGNNPLPTAWERGRV
jgi:hypothetical protein